MTSKSLEGSSRIVCETLKHKIDPCIRNSTYGLGGSYTTTVSAPVSVNPTPAAFIDDNTPLASTRHWIWDYLGYLAKVLEERGHIKVECHVSRDMWTVAKEHMNK